MAHETEEKALTDEGQRYVDRKAAIDQEFEDLEALGAEIAKLHEQLQQMQQEYS